MEARDAADLAERAADLLRDRIAAALPGARSVHVALAGGSTPRAAYAELAERLGRQAIDRERIAWWLGDERWVPVDDPQSNEGMARESLLARLGAPAAALRSWGAGSGDPVACAAAYGARLDRELAAGPAPLIVVLGMGADGHTASLFPGATACLAGGTRAPVGPSLPGTAAAIEPGAARGWRLTLCPGALRRASCIVFLVAGTEKAAAFRRAAAGDPATPAAWIRGRETVFIVTRDVLDDGGRAVRMA